MRDSEFRFMKVRLDAMRDVAKAQNLARHFVKFCLRHNYLHDFLCGSAVFEIVQIDENGKKVFREDIVLNALYERYGTDKSVERKVNRALVRALKNSKTSKELLNLLSVLKYHMNREQQNKAVFRLNFKKLMRVLRKDIKRNVGRYKTNFDGYGKTGIWSNLMEYNEYFSQFGYSFSDE